MISQGCAEDSSAQVSLWGGSYVVREHQDTSPVPAVAHKIDVFHQEWFLEAPRFFVGFTTAEEPLVAVGETEYAGAEVGPPGDPVQQRVGGRKGEVETAKADV